MPRPRDLSLFLTVAARDAIRSLDRLARLPCDCPPWLLAIPEPAVPATAPEYKTLQAPHPQCSLSSLPPPVQFPPAH